jgi:hypothetical protein
MTDGLNLFPERTESLGEGMKLPDEVAARRHQGGNYKWISASCGC